MELIYLCIKVFFCRIIDVSLSSYRTVIMVKGKSGLAAAIAIVEGLVWFLVVREALSYSATNFLETLDIAFAYSFGLAAGIYVGTKIASKFSGGMVQVQVVTSSQNSDMINKIQEEGYAITVIDGNASNFSGKKYVIFAEIKDSKLNDFKKMISTLDEKAFIMVNETKYVYNGFIKK